MFVYGVVSLATIGVVTTAAFGADWGARCPAAVLGPGLVFSVVFLTALIIGLARTQRQAEGIGSIIVFGLALLGGDFFFISSAPSAIKHLALLTPNGWAIRGFTDLATIGGGFATIVEPVDGHPHLQRRCRCGRAQPCPPGGELVRALAIARASGRRVLRDRVSLFFLIVLPIVVIVIVGAVAQGFNTFRVGVVNLDGTTASRQLVAELSHASGLAVVAYPNLASLDKAVGRSEINAGHRDPPGARRRHWRGRAVTVSVIAEQANNTQQAAATRVSSVVDAFGGRVEAAQFATRYGGNFAENLARASSL